MLRLLTLLRLPILAVALLAPVVAAAPASNSKAAAAPSHLAVGDAQLDSTIRTKLAKSKIGKDGFRFRVQRGVVTWEGNTRVPQHKGAATRMARTSGASQVVNNIKVTANVGPAGLRKAYVQP